MKRLAPLTTAILAAALVGGGASPADARIVAAGAQAAAPELCGCD